MSLPEKRDRVTCVASRASAHEIVYTVKKKKEKKVAIPLQSKTENTGRTFTVSACRSEHYPIRQWHMVRNKAFVLWDLKIRIVFPLNQWAVCFTAMNNALPLQNQPPSLPSFLSLPSRSVFAMLAVVQCLKCFHTFALHNKVKVLIPSLRELLHFLLTILPGWLMMVAGAGTRDVNQTFSYATVCPLKRYTDWEPNAKQLFIYFHSLRNCLLDIWKLKKRSKCVCVGVWGCTLSYCMLALKWSPRELPPNQLPLCVCHTTLVHLLYLFFSCLSPLQPSHTSRIH